MATEARFLVARTSTLSQVVDHPRSAGLPEPNPHEHVVSFIIPALNEEKYIGRCLESIYRLQLASGIAGIEVIVVDNQSCDRTAEVSRALGAGVIEVEPGRPARARNAGAHAAQGDWLAFVDADCELAADWLSTCGAHLLANPRVVASGSVFASPTSRAPWVERAWHKLALSARAAGPIQVRALTMNFLVRRTAFERIGGFDESLGTCEDCDLSYKLGELGTLIIDPQTHATHLGESHTLGELFRREAWRTAGNFRLALKRPRDLQNWLSLLLPPCLVLGFLFQFAGAVASAALSWPVGPWVVALTATVGATVMLVLRKTVPNSVIIFAQLMVVFVTYLAGRTAGLFWSFKRVDR